MTAADDPGWRPRDVRTPLGQLRLIFLAMFAWLGLLLVMLPFMSGDRRDAGVLPQVVAGAGVVSLGVLSWLRARPLPATEPVALARTYRRRTLLGVAISEASALIGFACALATGRTSLFLLGLGFAALGFATVAPTRTNLERRDRELAPGGGRPLLEALRAGPPPRAGGPRIL